MMIEATVVRKLCTSIEPRSIRSAIVSFEGRRIITVVGYAISWEKQRTED